MYCMYAQCECHSEVGQSVRFGNVFKVVSQLHIRISVVGKPGPGDVCVWNRGSVCTCVYTGGHFSSHSLVLVVGFPKGTWKLFVQTSVRCCKFYTFKKIYIYIPPQADFIQGYREIVSHSKYFSHFKRFVVFIILFFINFFNVYIVFSNVRLFVISTPCSSNFWICIWKMWFYENV